MHSQKHRGISLIIPPLPSERTGRGFCRASVQAFEIPLQIIRHYCSQINPLSLKTAFVTYRESVSYKQTGKRCPFALQKGIFYNAKGRRLKSKREINWQKQPPKYSLPKPLQGEGMCLAGYGMLWVGEMEGWRIGLKGCLFILNGQMFRGQK